MNVTKNIRVEKSADEENAKKNYHRNWRYKSVQAMDMRLKFLTRELLNMKWEKEVIEAELKTRDEEIALQHDI